MFLTQMIPCIFVICTQGYQVIMVNLSNYTLEHFRGQVMVKAEIKPLNIFFNTQISSSSTRQLRISSVHRKTRDTTQYSPLKL